MIEVNPAAEDKAFSCEVPDSAAELSRLIEGYRSLRGNLSAIFAEGEESHTEKEAVVPKEYESKAICSDVTDRNLDTNIKVLNATGFRRQGLLTVELEDKTQHKIVWRVKNGRSIKITSDLDGDQLAKLFSELTIKGIRE